MNRAWYRVALGRPEGATLAVAPGEHLGEAIAVATSRFKRAWPIAVAPAPPDEVPLGESVGKGVVVDRGAVVEVDPDLRWPTGVVPSLAVPGRELAAIRPGWVRHADAEVAVVIEAQVLGDRAPEVFLELVERLPVADNLELKLMDHHDGGGPTEVWLSPRLTVKKAIRFLDDHDVEVLANGHLEASIYLRAEKSTLRLTDTKTIVWLSEDAATADRVAGWFGELGIARAERIVTLEDVAHYHYRQPATSTRPRLTRKLESMRLRKVG
jgi:hypothetical protein